jgi:hypothetical protein
VEGILNKNPSGTITVQIFIIILSKSFAAVGLKTVPRHRGFPKLHLLARKIRWEV